MIILLQLHLVPWQHAGEKLVCSGLLCCELKGPLLHHLLQVICIFLQLFHHIIQYICMTTVFLDHLKRHFNISARTFLKTFSSHIYFEADNKLRGFYSRSKGVQSLNAL